MIEILDGIHEIVNYRGEFKVRIYLNKEYEDYPLHWHADAEIIMPVENTYKVIVDGNSYTLCAKDIIVIPSCELHEIQAPAAGFRIILQFDCSMLCWLTGFNPVFHAFHPCVLITPSTMPEIQSELSSLVLGMASEYFSTMPLKEASIFSMLVRFLTIMGRNHINKNENLLYMKKQKRLEYLNVFFNVCNYINEHCAENIRIEDVANIAGFSKFHFSRLFKQVMNISWYDYLINRRILQAEKLLIEPELSVMQVAMKAGFSSLATFNRIFKAKKHCTPTEYKSLYGVHAEIREKNRNDNAS